MKKFLILLVKIVIKRTEFIWEGRDALGRGREVGLAEVYPPFAFGEGIGEGVALWGVVGVVGGEGGKGRPVFLGHGEGGVAGGCWRGNNGMTGLTN